MNTLSLLYTTVSNESEANKLAQLALDRKLAACVNIIPSGRSIYLWKGKIENNPECYMLFKTLPENIESLKILLLEHHPYDTPALIHWDAQTSAGFFEYINNELNKSQGFVI